LTPTQQKIIESYDDQYCELVQALVFDDSEIISEIKIHHSMFEPRDPRKLGGEVE
jgi:hypothetical protein